MPMWQRISLQARITLLFGLVLVLVVIGHIVYAVTNSGPRIAAEQENTVRLAREFVETAVGSASQTPDPRATLASLVQPLQNLAHVRVLFMNSAGIPPFEQIESSSAAPDWFVRLVRPEPRSTRVPVEIDGVRLGYLLILPRAGDEVGEIWGGLVKLVLAEASFMAALLVLTGLVVRRALSPIASLDAALERLEQRAYETRITDIGPPELDRIFRRFNSLASGLQTTAAENRTLTAQLVSVADDERRELGREFHDELGPQLFAIRAYARALVGPPGAVPDTGASTQLGQSILDQTDSLQEVTRRILARLRPPALHDLGLRAALSSLVAGWQEMHDWEVALRVDGALDDLDATVQLTAYRVVQEALTNAARHAGAATVDIEVSRSGSGTILVRVQDDGIGLPANLRTGYGMAGMRDRVRALGGELSITQRAPRGVTVEATLPADPSTLSFGTFSRPSREIGPLASESNSPLPDAEGATY
jgi:two-component system sensor histidine kinase UhpB